MRGIGILFSFVSLLTAGTLGACSVFSIVKDGKVIVGNNNDNTYKLNMLLHVTPNRDGYYGRVCVSLETIPGWVPTGMKCVNEKGLVITHANVPHIDTPYDPDKPEFQHNFLEKIVAECATVKQAVTMVRAYSLPPNPHIAHIHLLLADPSGDSVILEWVNGDVKVIRRNGPTQIMTNSLISKPSSTEVPNSRLNRGTRMLSDVKDASVATAVSVLKEISVHAAQYKGDEVGTVESVVFDLTGRKVHLYYKRDFDHPLVLDLDEELAKGPRSVELKKLFPNPVPFETGDRYNEGPVVPKVPSGK